MSKHWKRIKNYRYKILTKEGLNNYYYILSKTKSKRIREKIYNITDENTGNYIACVNLGLIDIHTQE